MKYIKIIGFGMSLDTLTAEGLRAIETADAIIGAARLTKMLGMVGKPLFTEYEPNKIADIVRGNMQTRFAVLVSGDCSFYSAAGTIAEALKGSDKAAEMLKGHDDTTGGATKTPLSCSSTANSMTDAPESCCVEFIPGVSSFAYFFAKLGRVYEDAALVSLHGREANIVDTVRRNCLTFVLMSGNIGEIAERLTTFDFGELTVYIGENLGAADELIVTSRLSEILSLNIGKLAVLLIENPNADDRVRFGIPDDEFIRNIPEQKDNTSVTKGILNGESVCGVTARIIPMTKAEVRAVIMSKLAVKPNALCWDIGCGTGSVTAELALAAYKGKVYALDKNERAVSLTKQNCLKFQVGNVTVIQGEAPDALKTLPKPDAVFIGGNGGNLRDIINAVCGVRQERTSNTNAARHEMTDSVNDTQSGMTGNTNDTKQEISSNTNDNISRLVITAVTAESAYIACETLKVLNKPCVAARISVERGVDILKAENSVVVIWTEF